MSESNLPAMEYRGRKTRRADGHARRQALLEAALRLIQRDGIRAVRHRAVAQEANVPLAATTYYFKDIDELISDAFTLFAEQSLAANRELEQAAFTALSELGADRFSAAGREKLAHLLSQFSLHHIRKQVANRDARLIEHAFRTEALRNDKLAADVRIPYNATIALIRQFFQQLKTRDPEADSELMFGAMMHCEYQLILSGESRAAWELFERSLLRLYEAILASGS